MEVLGLLELAQWQAIQDNDWERYDILEKEIRKILDMFAGCIK